VIHHTVYISRERVPFDAPQLMELLKRAKEENDLREVTGLLLYHEGQFVQMLEGERRDVAQVMSRVAADNRHHDILRVIDEHSPFGRVFPGWSMGFVHMRFLDQIGIHGLLNNDIRQVVKLLASQPEVLAARVMLSIIQNNRIMV
jgi:hypothetical protein